MLEELMVKVEQHEITFIIFSVIALLFLGAILYLICCVHITRHDLRAAEERLTDGHNTSMFLHLLLCRGEDDGSLPFEEEWCESYAWWTQHEWNAHRPAEFQYIYNGIAQAIYGKRQQ